jgi:phospholipase/lecithinase/hemolysin
MISLLVLPLLGSLSTSVHALGLAPHQITSLVTFGDSYTDVGNTGDGGTAWPVYATSVYSKTKLFPFAKSGATCSNNITSRPFPSVFESQLPAYFGEKANGTLPKLSAEGTLFSLWIGTNDVGEYGLCDMCCVCRWMGGIDPFFSKKKL